MRISPPSTLIFVRQANTKRDILATRRFVVKTATRQYCKNNNNIINLVHVKKE